MIPQITLIIIQPFIVRGLGIIGGIAAELYPFFVRVEKGENTFCGGTIVSADAILTTAHCVYFRAKNRWAFYDEIVVVDADFTQPNWAPTAKVFRCAHYRPHVLYDPLRNKGASLYDIAVIKLRRKFDLNQPHNAVLKPCPSEEYFQGKYKYGTAIGLGVVSQYPEEIPDILMEATMEWFPLCGAYFLEPCKVNRKLQACYGVPGKVAICQGDSGGPLVYKNRSKVECLIGVASFTKILCDHFFYPNVFTLAGPFAEWIEKETRIVQL